MLDKSELSNKIAYISINPTGKFTKSAQIGFKNVGLFPKFMIHVNPKNRIKLEFAKYRFGIFRNFLLPKFKQHFGNIKSFDNEIINITIPVVRKVSSLNSSETIQFIIENNIRFLVNCGAGIFRSNVLSTPNLIVLNAHAGKLPEYRNMNVVEWALLNNDKVIGTIHLINSGIDTGAVLYEQEIVLRRNIDLESAKEEAFDKTIKMLGKTLVALEDGKVKPRIQPKDGKRWYTMHPYFKELLNKKLQK
jgi:folate-dependent phosphoribosylglycinamide formyltransferase PurN